MKHKILFLFCFLLVTVFTAQSQQDTTQLITPNRENSISQQQKPYVILISADGFRHDLADKYNASFLKKMRAEGVEAVSMKPSYPTLTFPNHYSIVTGLYPAHHGIVANTFYDRKFDEFYYIRNREVVQNPKWYGGIPLWQLAEDQKMLSASFYWVGSESHVNGVDPTYYYNYGTGISIDRRLQILKEWLELPEEKRPHFITFYFNEPDHSEHVNGVTSPVVDSAVQAVDDAVKKMYEITQSFDLPINFIFLSDHGMADVDTAHSYSLPAIDTSQFYIVNGGALVHLYSKNQDQKEIKKTFKTLKANAKNYQVYLGRKTPKRWHYNKKQDRQDRIGDILLVTYPPHVFGRTIKGRHGFDNKLPEMQATFYAWGPAFKSHQQISNFENIHVYPLIAQILGLKIENKIDGKRKALKRILKK